eukprot:jgi/Tetstr1/456877/TSEL_043549.t1
MEPSRHAEGEQPLLETPDDSATHAPETSQQQSVAACKPDDVQLNVDSGDDSWNRDAYPVAMPARLHEAMPSMIQSPYPAPQAVMHIPDLPDAAKFWRAQWPLMAAWLVLSTIVLLLNLMNLFPFVAAILGIVGASLHLCACCGGPELSGPVKSITVLAYISASFSTLTFFILAVVIIALPGDCDEMSSVQCSDAGGAWVIMDMLLLLGHVAVGVFVARRGHRMKKLLNPVTAGVVVLQ